MTIFRSSALSINELLIFDMRDQNGALFLKVSFFLALLSPSTVILPFTSIYASP